MNDLLHELLALRHPIRPMQALPVELRRLIPDPSQEDGFATFTHADLERLSPAERASSAFRLRVAVAACDPESVPLWFLERIARLEGV